MVVIRDILPRKADASVIYNERAYRESMSNKTCRADKNRAYKYNNALQALDVIYQIQFSYFVPWG